MTHLYHSLMGFAIFAGIIVCFVLFVLVFIVKISQPPVTARMIREARRNRNRLF